MQNTLSEAWASLMALLDSAIALLTRSLFKLGENDISVATIVYMLVAFLILNILAKRIKKLLVENILVKANVEQGVRTTVGTVTRFVIVFVGTTVIIQTAGIDLTALTLVVGTLGVGIGFGLQNITDNFISGIIILFEKPIKVGDRIEVGEIQGNVIAISFRATQVLTNDNISVIVPNSEFISSRVINWSHNNRNIRFKIPVGVSYNEDPQKIKSILMKVADENKNVLKDPEPSVLFDEYGDSSLNFILAVWTSTYTDRPRVLKSELYYEIFKEFKKHNVEIPFPQRDIHIKTPLSHVQQ
ncbi:MAG: mechanosensitive ion channel [Cyclobacteriaceae bacterium]